MKQKLTGHSQFSKVFKFGSQASFLTLIDLINSVFQIGSVSDNEKTTKETGNANDHLAKTMTIFAMISRNQEVSTQNNRSTNTNLDKDVPIFYLNSYKSIYFSKTCEDPDVGKFDCCFATHQAHDQERSFSCSRELISLCDNTSV